MKRQRIRFLLVYICMLSASGAFAATYLSREYRFPPEKELGRNLHNIKITDMKFQDATVKDVCTFLKKTAKEYVAQVERKEFELNVLLVSHEKANQVPLADRKVTMEFKSAYAYDVIRHLCQVLDVPFYVDSDCVVLGTEGDLVCRMYDVLPSVFTGCLQASSGGLSSNRIKEYFSATGVNFPEGASIQYFPQIGKLFVRNTRNNLSILEGTFDVLNVIPNQVQITFRAMEVVDPSVVTFAGRESEGYTVDRTKQEYAMRTVTYTNQEFVLQNEEEHVSKGRIKPLLEMTAIVQTALCSSNSVAAKNGSCSLIVLPVVSPEGRMITLALQGRVTSCPLADGVETSKGEFNTTISLYNGASMRLWLNTPGPGKKGGTPPIRRYLTIKVDLVGPDGRILKLLY